MKVRVRVRVGMGEGKRGLEEKDDGRDPARREGACTWRGSIKI